MEHLKNILKIVDKELEEVERSGKFRSREELDDVYKMSKIAKNVYCIMDMEQGGGSQYSENGSYRGYSSQGGSYDGGSYNGSYNSSYNNGQGSYNGSYNGGGSYADGGSYAPYERTNAVRNDYSGHSRQEFMNELKHLAEEAPDGNTRSGLQRVLEQLKS